MTEDSYIKSLLDCNKSVLASSRGGLEVCINKDRQRSYIRVDEWWKLRSKGQWAPENTQDENQIRSTLPFKEHANNDTILRNGKQSK